MKKIGLLIVILFWICSGCEDALNMKPENSLTYENGLTTPKDFESILNGINRGLQFNRTKSPVGRAHVHKGEYADEWSEGSIDWSRTLNYPSSNSGRGENMESWASYYQCIISANIVLNYVDIADLPEEYHALYKGQAWFYKALAYFEMIQCWGDCVLIRDELELFPVEKTSWDEIATYAIGLTEKAIELLPEFDKLKDANGNDVTYKTTPCKGAANALLAYLCAWKAGCKYFARDAGYDEMELWRMAEDACSRIIDSDVYSLAGTPEEVCTSVLVGDSKESIYEFVVKGFWNENDIGTANPGDDYFGYPVLDWFPLDFMDLCNLRVKATSMIKMFPQGDLRGEAYFYELYSLSEDSEANGYACLYKYRQHYIHTDESGDLVYEGVDQNQILWRLADIYLLRAECRARLGGEYISGAIDDLNEIRDRARAKRYETSEYNGDLRYTIFKEREKELLIEGHRYWDIIRNGYVRTELAGNFKTLTDQDIKDGALFLMIDASSFTGNPLLRQNTYWFRKL